MTERSLTIIHNDVTYTGHVATIKSTILGREDHGILSAYLDLQWAGSGVLFGGYSLDTPGDRESDDRRIGSAFGMDHVIELLRVVGVDSWERLKDKQVIVLFGEGGSWGGRALGLAHVTDEHKVFILQEHADAWKARLSEASNGNDPRS